MISCKYKGLRQDLDYKLTVAYSAHKKPSKFLSKCHGQFKLQKTYTTKELTAGITAAAVTRLALQLLFVFVKYVST